MWFELGKADEMEKSGTEGFFFLSEVLIHFYSLLFLPAPTKYNSIPPFLSAYCMSFNLG